MGEAKLYVIPGSHPSRSAMLMLDRKGIPFKRVDLMPVISKGVVRAQGFPGVTVPALKLNGRKIQGSREIARELDHIQPEPALYPADPGEARQGRGGGGLGRRIPAEAAQDELVGLQARSLADGELFGGRAARRPSGLGGEDRRADRRNRRPAESRTRQSTSSPLPKIG